MSISAKQAGSIGVSMEECDEIIDRILEAIYSEIATFPATTGQNILKYDLPIQFNVPSDDTGTKKANRQIIIYGAVIKKLKTEGYSVYIKLTESKNTLYVVWESNYNRALFEELSKEVKGSVVSSEDMLHEMLKKQPKSKSSK